MKNLFLSAALATTMLAGANAAHAVDMKLSLWIPPMHPLVAGLTEWGKDVETASGGEIAVKLFPAEQLGKAGDHYDMARDGIVDMAMVAPGYSAGRFPIWSIIELPFTFKNSTDGAKALHEWYAAYADREMPDVKVCLVTMHHPGTLHTTNTEVRTPDQLNGLRIRPAGPVTSAFVTSQGGNTVQAALPEIRELAERGVVDGVTWPPDIFVIRAESALKYHMGEPFYITAQAQVINQDFYAGLTDTQKAVIDDHCTPEWSAKVNQGWANGEMAALERLRGLEGHTVYSLTEDEFAQWKEAAAPLVEDVLKAAGDRYGIDATQVQAELFERLDANNARY